MSTCKRFPSAFWRENASARRSLLPEGVKYQNCTIAPRSYHHRERSLNSILLMRIDPTSGQRSRVVSSPETSLEAFLKLRKRQICEKRCELHFDSQGCLQICRVGLNGSCWECWVERGQFVQVHICQNVNETFAFVTLNVLFGCLAG